MPGPDGRIRVLWLAKGLGPGGMERLLVTHAKFGDRERFEYSAAYLVDRPNSVIAELDSLDVECFGLGGEHDLDPRWVYRLRRLVRDRGIDVVHFHSPMPAAVARPALRLMRKGAPRLVYTEHNTWECYGPITRLANAATYRLDDAQLAVSSDARDSVPALLSGRVEVLTHGIDVAEVASHLAGRDAVRAELGIAPDAVVMIIVAHLRREKAYEVMLDAARQVLDCHPSAMFLSVGHGPLEAELKARHSELNLGGQFKFLGFRSDALRLMAGADIFSLASHQEGLPVSFMEATALGLPTVATSVGGLVEHIEDGKTGLLVSPGNSTELAEALGRVIEDDELRNGLAAATALQAGRFSSLPAVTRQEEIYVDLVGRSHMTKTGSDR